MDVDKSQTIDIDEFVYFINGNSSNVNQLATSVLLNVKLQQYQYPSCNLCQQPHWIYHMFTLFVCFLSLLFCRFALLARLTFKTWNSCFLLCQRRFVYRLPEKKQRSAWASPVRRYALDSLIIKSTKDSAMSRHRLTIGIVILPF